MFIRIRQVAPMCPLKLCRELCKMAEPIDLPFGLWILVSQRKHKLNRIRKVAHKTEPSICGVDAALCQITLTSCSVSAQLTEKTDPFCQ